MRIAPHHLPGTAEHDFSELIRPSPTYQPQCAWPDDCTVQWGHGIIPAVPFFEAFPKASFIRGEGVDIAAAERDAFAKYERDAACDHVWGRQRPGGALYTNGAAFCRKCGGFRGSMFPELKPSGWWRKPLSRSEMWHLESLENDHETSAAMDRRFPSMTASRRRMARVLRLRFNLFGVITDGNSTE